ncbi:hypothetical protein AACH06_28440, partial [Ideonella sp. DXS29W]
AEAAYATGLQHRRTAAAPLGASYLTERSASVNMCSPAAYRALEVRHDILKCDVSPAYSNLNVGDWTRGADLNYTRSSDFMAGHILAFARYDSANNAQWNKVYDEISRAVNDQFVQGREQAGLVPDFKLRSSARDSPVTGRKLETKSDGDFAYQLRPALLASGAHLTAPKGHLRLSQRIGTAAEATRTSTPMRLPNTKQRRQTPACCARDTR